MDIIDDMNAHEDYMCSHSFGLVVVDAIIGKVSVVWSPQVFNNCITVTTMCSLSLCHLQLGDGVRRK